MAGRRFGPGCCQAAEEGGSARGPLFLYTHTSPSCSPPSPSPIQRTDPQVGMRVCVPTSGWGGGEGDGDEGLPPHYAVNYHNLEPAQPSSSSAHDDDDYDHIHVVIVEDDERLADLTKEYLESKYHINLVPCIQYYDKGKKKTEFLNKREYEDIIKFIEKSLN